MKAAIYTRYGSPEVIQIIDVEIPSPKPNEILVKIKASSVTRADTMMRQGIPKFGRLFLGLFKPKNTALGTGFSGVVESVGEQITTFKIGDEVFGEKLFSNGCNADYLCISEDMVIELKPDTISHSQAAPICDGFLTSYNFLKDIANIQQGQHILINGASGSLGSAAVQLSKLVGAKVTVVCSAKNIDFVLALGADDVLDYTKVNLNELPYKYDVIYDAVGKLSYKDSKKIISSDGIFMTPVLSIQILWQMLWNSKQVKFTATGMKKTKDLKRLFNELVHFFKQSKLHTSIDRTYGLSDISKAHQYLETGRKVGNVVIVNL
ncbi:NAD(P)-dependent alcohol dehydrogenase [Psychroserpens sp. SPM9]|uniref:NAD(P)-dependent alcohol dehydrogenase n=1 Tax=Psychroserpens sp. SPM9 TaxID=2975598 RepID=UPI0021A87966|nr:NAD(P)-dependent alcohol dehydrogenase [Psychroserpens sp. SPM9]MDG5491318.1 NAD(P)-dependent alcohol dehydrogenase [Psychroserpens sp. SPM9]